MGFHRKQVIVKLEFACNRQLVDAVKANTQAVWSTTMRC
jgi:hypothetical protein